MGLKNSGKGDERSAPYFRVYNALTADVDLTEAVTNARCATSGLIVSTAAAGALVIEDASGTEVSFLVEPGTHDLPLAAVRLDESTADALTVLAYWHPRGGAA